MNAVKRRKPNISPDDIQRLLFHLEDARNYIIKYGAAQELDSSARSIADSARSAIDGLAGQITGNPQYLWQTSASAGGNQLVFERGAEKEAKRYGILGVRIPVVARLLDFTSLGS